jgi:hypothetical protein
VIRAFVPNLFRFNYVEINSLPNLDVTRPLDCIYIGTDKESNNIPGGERILLLVPT